MTTTEMPSRNARKVVEAVNLLIGEGGTDSNTRLKVVKNLWAADRFSLRRFAQTITDAYYVAMKNGPVSSYALRVIKQDEMASEADLELWRNSFETRGFDICPIAEIGTSALSLVDQRMLLKAASTFRGLERFDMADNVSHAYPEWSVHKSVFSAYPKTSVPIDNLRFFENPSIDPYFSEDPEILEAARETYAEKIEMAQTTGLALV
ncbi:DUF4065 domain-containing protein [Corynebacterium macginleyi]|uniref:DUF4065 domain-containing protein n=2 Tax=Corynebacterium macginleyi TaxID=38290 RepID=A0A3M0GD51_9CORY|nr:Panacea domain-containing protein [Corynebacterium macginleyi]MBK4157556.1 DUF4065 domain-containing protein [Corynebacterium macginleyi]RMB62640.1 DUF4065 domain-containing protein [Corynebacterium macginleyi]